MTQKTETTQASKRGRGRPRYEPTVADRRTVAHMAAAGIPHDQIAECIGEKGIDDNTLRRHFGRELTTSKNQVTAMATAAIVKGIKAGEAFAICFWLKTRAGFRETQAHAFVDKDGKDRPFLLSDADRLIAEADEADAAEGKNLA